MNIFIRPNSQAFEWFTVSAQGESEHFSGDTAALSEFVQSLSESVQWILIAPSLTTTQTSIEFSDKERKHIVKAIPFLLEDDLLTEAHQLHIVTDKPAAQSVDVLAIDGDILRHWLSDLSALGIRPAYCLPEVKLLLNTESDWDMYFRNGEFIFKQDNKKVLGFEAEHFPLVLELLSDGFKALPNKIALIVDDEQSLDVALQYIPQSVKDVLDAKTLPYALMLQSQFQQQIKVWNLLKGSFAYGQQWMAALLPWKWVGISLFVLVFIQLAVTAVEYRQLTVKNRYQAQEIETLFRSVIPRGQIVNPQKQVQNELTRAQQGGAGGFINKLDKIGKILASHNLQSMNTLNYEKEKNEIRIDLLVPNYDQLQAIINEMQKQGLSSDIQNSNAQGNELRVRIRISG